MHRVRTVIPYLSFTNLRKEKCLPKKGIFTGIKRGGSFPKIVYLIEYFHFGMFLDWFIRKILCNIHSIPKINKEIDANIDPFSLFVWCSNNYFPGESICNITEEIFGVDLDYYKKIQKFVRKHFQDAKNIEIEPEWIFGKIAGHPDLVIDGVVYDIKTTGQFNKMRIDTILQLLTYFSIGKNNKKNISKIGVILPAQDLVITFDLSDWNHTPFWNSVEKALETKISLISTEKEQEIYINKIYPHVGRHIPKSSTIAKTLLSMPINLPLQIFLGGRTNTTPKIRNSDIQKTVKLGYRWYIHAPYTINVSKRYDDDWNITCIQNFLNLGNSMGCKGIIIHCGIAKTDDPETALKNMRRFVKKASKNATKKCKLIIETPAGRKGELLSRREDFVDFYQNLPNKSKIGICVDTCHVYSAGYKPNLYLKYLVEKEIPITLIHFNDSKNLRGACKDEHAPIGYGYIGLKTLNKVGFWAIENSIDLVNE